MTVRKEKTHEANANIHLHLPIVGTQQPDGEWKDADRECKDAGQVVAVAQTGGRSGGEEKAR